MIYIYITEVVLDGQPREVEKKSCTKNKLKLHGGIVAATSTMANNKYIKSYNFIF